MIVKILDSGKCEDEGCGCCASIHEHKNDIFRELKDNIRIAIQACDLYDIDFDYLVETVFEEGV